MNDDIIALTKKIIEIPSDVNNRDACLEVLKVAQEELNGFSFLPFAKDGTPSILYTNTPTPTKTCKIIFNAHLDVVPGEASQFKPYEKDGKLYGRGAYDMKAAAAAMILVFKHIAKDLPFTLGLQLTTDEEIIGYKGVGYQLDQGVSADFVITGECGSNLQITNRLRGLYVIKLTASGKKAHAGHLWHGENAIIKLYNVINNILEVYPTPDKPSWQTSVNLARIETTNDTHNMVPADATAILDVRSTPEEREEVLEKIESLIPEDILFEVIKTMPGLNTPLQNPYVQNLAHTIETVLKDQAKIVDGYGGSDIVFYPTYGIDGVEFGPIGSGQHSNEEWVDFESLGNYYEILKSFLLSVKQ